MTTTKNQAPPEPKPPSGQSTYAATTSDFNDVMITELNWKSDIEARTPQGWYGLATPDGWDQLIFELHTAIKQRFPDYQVYQIKEKFGTLRYYCSVEADPAVRELIRTAEVRSASLCETCGAPGTLRDSTGWMATLCDTHFGSTVGI